MADGGIKIKLAVDRERNRVLLADASSDFVDVLLSFLTLPLSALQLVAGTSSPGCLSTLCQGVSCLSESKVLRFDACHDMLLRPRHEDEFKEIQCLRHEKYMCSCYPAIVKSEPSLKGHGWGCRCWQVMARVAHVFNRKEGAEKFVKGNLPFVISDDLVIKPASTANTNLLLQRIYSGRIDHTFGFQEIEVCVGWDEVVSMVKASFSSKTVFTDTFLSKKTEPRATVNMYIAPNIRHPVGELTDALPQSQFSIKVFYDKYEKKVMYAECNHEFVDLLLSFLIYPVACVIKNHAGTNLLGCSLDNLYGSVIDLDASSLLRGSCLSYIIPNRQSLLDPGMDRFFGSSDAVVKRWFSLCCVLYCDCPRVRVCTCLQFVNGGTYVVDDDLLIYRVSATRVMKHWCNREKDRVLEMDIAISKEESGDLLSAALTSKTALTDVLKSKLEEKCKFSLRLPPNHFQIFVKLHTGKTITLDVENHDTIAIVKHKINQKAGLQLSEGYPCQLVYGSRLPDSSTIADCNIGKGCTVHFALSCTGCRLGTCCTLHFILFFNILFCEISHFF